MMMFKNWIVIVAALTMMATSSEGGCNCDCCTCRGDLGCDHCADECAYDCEADEICAQDYPCWNDNWGDDCDDEDCCWEKRWRCKLEVCEQCEIPCDRYGQCYSKSSFCRGTDCARPAYAYGLEGGWGSCWGTENCEIMKCDDGCDVCPPTTGECKNYCNGEEICDPTYPCRNRDPAIPYPRDDPWGFPWDGHSRRLDDPVAQPWDRRRLHQQRRLHEALRKFGALDKIVYKEERMELEASCNDVIYGLSLFAMPGPHFFLGAVPKDFSHNDCPALSFVSMQERKVLLKGEEADVQNMLRFNEASARTYKLREILKAFDGAKPITGDGYDLEKNSCLHFVGSMTRPLGVPETKEAADFVVDYILADKNFVNMARRHQGGTGAMAATLFGPSVLRGYVEDLVYAQFDFPGRKLPAIDDMEENKFDASTYGIKLGFDQRHLQESCSEEMYDVDLVVSYQQVSILLQPSQDATLLGCKYGWLDAAVDENGNLIKESFQLDSIADFHDELSRVHGSILTAGIFRLDNITNAHERASLYAPDSLDIFGDLMSTNNVGDYISNFFIELGHESSQAETMLITHAVLLSTPGLADMLRPEMDESIAASMTDEELIQRVVEQRTGQMYPTTMTTSTVPGHTTASSSSNSKLNGPKASSSSSSSLHDTAAADHKAAAHKYEAAAQEYEAAARDFDDAAAREYGG